MKIETIDKQTLRDIAWTGTGDALRVLPSATKVQSNQMTVNANSTSTWTVGFPVRLIAVYNTSATTHAQVGPDPGTGQYAFVPASMFVEIPIYIENGQVKVRNTDTVNALTVLVTAYG